MGTARPLHAATTFDLTTASIADINAAFEAGALTSERLTQLYLSRIEAFDQRGPKLNVILRVNPRALEEARALDAERKAKGPRSPLHGIPVLLKDNVAVAGFPTTGGFFGLRDSLATPRMPSRVERSVADVLVRHGGRCPRWRGSRPKGTGAHA